ncbi:undecaprenyl-phosphate galactose phosphotransferase WbaP [Teredinibacter turnerae]|uniref:undecaprenyl-phosphate galactose phosphotransferase WbaP n=1 Tax=Teredinibacter turnerae TaxID=2426 RepID=UPI0003634A40|nr:undecaprenyl-phosphate galactose phosphotransferase WbaP [Teredinibacter turnerae]
MDRGIDLSALPCRRENPARPEPQDFGDLPVMDYWLDQRSVRRAFDGVDRRQAFMQRKNVIAFPARNQAGTARRLQLRLRRAHLIHQLFLLLGDAFALALSLLFVTAIYVIWTGQGSQFVRSLMPSLWEFGFVGTVYLMYNWLQGNYAKKQSIADTLRAVSKAVFVAISVQSVLAGLVGNRALLLGLLSTWCLALVMVPIFRIGIKRIMYNCGIWAQPTVILGAGENARRTADAIQSDWLLGSHIVEFINFSEDRSQPQPESTPLTHIELNGHYIPVRNVNGLTAGLFEALGNPHIVVATDSADFWDIIRLLYEANVSYSSITIAPRMDGVPMIGLAMTHVFRHDVLMLTVQNNLARFIPRLIKRSFDLVLSLSLIVALAPVLAVIALAVRASGKHVFYGHQRVGRDGRLFGCYKFRSMFNNSDQLLRDHLRDNPEARAEWNRDYKLKQDPRVTRVGNFLRKTSLDELPQLWNVVKGDMSLVGPRPVVREELLRYHDKQGFYSRVRPGITGLWQVSGRNDVTYEERVNLDTWYSKNWSLWYDVVILVKTLGVVVKRSGAY